MHAQSREALFLLRISTIFSLLSSWGCVQLLLQGAVKQPSEVPDRPTLAAGRLSLNLTTGPATKHQKGKPGKGSPRLEKSKKKNSGREVGRERNGGGGGVRISEFHLRSRVW